MVVSKQKVWQKPRLQRFGSFAELTQGCDKDLGTSDGYTFQGSDIVCVDAS